MTELLTHEAFEPHRGTVFGISVNDQRDDLTLSDVQVQADSRGYQRCPFTLIFTGARKDAVFDGSLYSLEHPQMGTVDIFLSPLARNQDGTFQYQAIFN